MEEGYRQLVGILSKYVNKFDKRDKMYLVGYNNAGFDNNFLRALFQQCGDKYFGSWFYPNCMDVYVMVTPFLMGVRNDMENFKLMTVARTMGIEIDENKLHDATYDIELTRDIFYRIFAAGDMDLQHTTDTLINDMDGAETLGIRSFIINNSRAIRRRLFPDLGDYEHIGYDGGSKDKINRKRLIGNTYQIYRSILHQLAIDENWNNVYSGITLPSGDMGTIKVERVDDERESKGV